MKNERISFMFYLEWRKQIELMEDDELRRFITNLLDYHEDMEINLPTRIEKATWYGIEPALRVNNEKYYQRVEKNRENGKLGGRPTKSKSKNQMVYDKPNGLPQNPKNPVIGDRQETTGNSKKNIDNSKKITNNRITDNGEKSTDNPVEEIDCVSNSFTGDVNTNSIEDNTSLEQHQVILNKAKVLFKDHLNWQQEIEELGTKSFIGKYSQIYGSNEEFYDLVKDYYYKIYLGFRD